MCKARDYCSLSTSAKNVRKYSTTFTVALLVAATLAGPINAVHVPVVVVVVIGVTVLVIENVAFGGSVCAKFVAIAPYALSVSVCVVNVIVPVFLTV